MKCATRQCRSCHWKRVIHARVNRVGRRNDFNGEWKVMNLRNKLLLSFMTFIAALVAIGVWSAWRLRELGGVSQGIISHNYESVVAAQDMKESLERMDSSALFLLLGNHDRAMSQFNEHRARFNAAFERAAGNITEPGEAEIIESIREGRGEYYRRFEAFIAEGERR